jgi:ADP-ribose pyrophosphatase
MADERAIVRDQRVLHRGGTGVFSSFDVEFVGGHLVQLELLEHPGASAVLPFLDPQRVVLLRQYRFATRGEIWEVPAGKRDPGEDPHSCAGRELLEETGYAAERLTPLGRILTAPGFTDEVIHLFRADGLRAGEHQREPSELIELCEFSFDEALAMVLRGEIIDVKTIAALFLARERAAR